MKMVKLVLFGAICVSGIRNAHAGTEYEIVPVSGIYATIAEAQTGCASQANTLPCPTYNTINKFVGVTYFKLQSTTKSTGDKVESYACYQRLCGADGPAPEFSVRDTSSFQYRTPSLALDRGGVCPLTVTGYSKIEPAALSVGESVPLIGAPFTLEYNTKYQQGKKLNYTIRSDVPKRPSNKTYPKITMRILDEQNSVLYAQTYTYPVSFGTLFQWTWDGKDAGGSLMRGNRTFKIQTKFIDSAGAEIDFQTYDRTLGGFKAESIGLGGWLPSLYAYYDSERATANFGDGTIRNDVVALQVGGGIQRIASEDGNTVYDFNSSGDIYQIRSGLTGQVLYEFAYNGLGQPTTIIDGFANTTYFAYDGSDHLQTITAPNDVSGSKVTTITTDSDGRPVSITTPGSSAYGMTYHSTLKLLETFTKPDSSVTTFGYNADGLLTSDKNTLGGSVTLTEVNSSTGRIVRLISKMGRTTTYTPSSSGSGVVYPDYKKWYSQKDGDGNILISEANQVTQSNELTSDARFGGTASYVSRLTRRFGGTNYAVGYERSDAVVLTTPTDPFSVDTITRTIVADSQQSTSVYDNSTMTWTHTSPEGVVTTETIDAFERPVETKTGGLTKVEYTYSGKDLTQIKQGARETNFSYNIGGLLEKITDPGLNDFLFSYTPDEQLSSVTLPGPKSISYGYDAAGNMTSITNPKSIVHSLNFGASNGLLETYSPPTVSGITINDTTFSYDNDRQLTKVTSPTGVTEFAYASYSGKLTQKKTDDGYTIYNYNNNEARYTYVQSPNNVRVAYGYYGDLISSETISDMSTNLVRSVYDRTFSDSNGRIISDRVTAGGQVSEITYSYNGDGRISQAGDLSITYNTDGLVSGTSIGNVTETYGYDSFGAMTSYVVKYSGTTRYSLTITRDDFGRVDTKTELLAGVTSVYDYDYDSWGRLSSATKNGSPYLSVTWDDNGNRSSITIAGTTTTATFDDQDRVISDTNFDFAYDDSGRLISKTSPLTSVVNSFTYNADGNLISATYPPAAPTTREFDALGRITKLGIPGLPTGRRLIYTPEGRIAAGFNEANGQIGKRMVYATHPRQPDYYIEYQSNPGRYKVVRDHLGSPRAFINVETGVGLGNMEHDPFGRIISDTSTNSWFIGFAGGLYDATARVVRFGARDYMPADGRWTTKDPILFDGGDTNLYGYVMSDPINFVDPMGLDADPAQEAFGRRTALAGSAAMLAGSFIPGHTGNAVVAAGAVCTAYGTDQILKGRGQAGLWDSTKGIVNAASEMISNLSLTLMREELRRQLKNPFN